MELLIRVKSKTSPDPYKDCQLTKRGHVIVVMPDGHDWTPTERTNPEWRIVSLPSLSRAEAEAMLASEPGLETNRMLQRRAFKLDVDALPTAAKVFMNDDSRKTPIGTITVTQLRAIKTRLAPLIDPDRLP